MVKVICIWLALIYIAALLFLCIPLAFISWAAKGLMVAILKVSEPVERYFKSELGID